MKIVWISLAAALGLLVAGSTTLADWSWPWSSKEASRPAVKNKSEPSTLAKLNQGTKNFVGGLFGKKPETKKRSAAYQRSSPYARKEPKKDSFFSSMFKPKEPPPLKTTNDWMNLEPIRP